MIQCLTIFVTACVCNTIGSELCDHQSGACLCKPNIVGATCDRCIVSDFKRFLSQNLVNSYVSRVDVNINFSYVSF